MTRAALVLLGCVSGLVFGCAASGPCRVESVATITAEYAAEVLSECPKGSTTKTCAAMPAIEQRRKARIALLCPN